MPLLTELENLFLTGGYRDFAPTALCRRFSVAVGIPACRGAGASCPAEKTLAHTHRAEKFQNVIPLHHSFRAAGRSPSTADETSTATTHPQLFPDVTWNDHNETDH
jgi:hypothetical protein